LHDFFLHINGTAPARRRNRTLSLWLLPDLATHHVPLFNPRSGVWDEHFEWIEEGTVIRGKTPQGRATAAALYMNHPDIVAARRLWVIAGWHPPTY
jgi:hypothetical protein